MIILRRILGAAASAVLAFSATAHADSTAQTLPFNQTWGNTGLITTDDNWNSVPGVIGYRGDGLASTGADPQTVLNDGSSTPVDVNANETNPDSFSSGGVAEFEITNPTVALQGSGTADAPHLVLHLDTTGQSGISLGFTARDLESSATSAAQQIAVHYRVGGSGSYTNVPDGYLADATIGGATQETDVCVALPSAVDNQSLVELRIMTANASGSDEWVGIDDIVVATSSCEPSATVADESQTEGDVLDLPMTFTLTLAETATMYGVTFDVDTVDGTATTADGDYQAVSIDGASIPSGQSTFEVEVRIFGDMDQEPDEQFTVEFSNFLGLAENPGTLVATGTILNDDFVAVDIHEIQGSGTATPFDDQMVETTESVVTGVGPEGFTIQTLPGMDDGDPDTSEGIYVYTAAPPTDDSLNPIAVGDHVVVVGTAVEFFDLTEINQVTSITVNSSGNPLPAPVVFDTTTPSPNPATPSCAIEYECYEGMLVSVASGFVNSGNQSFGSDPFAEAYVSAAGQRIFREPGLEPSSRGILPTWDGNPELFELDPDKLGLMNRELFGGDTFTATGVIGYEFGDYELWPTSLTVTPTTMPRPVTVPSSDDLPAGADALRIASFNIFRLFDDVDDPSDMNSQGEVRDDAVSTTEQWNRHRIKVAKHVVEVLQSPDVIGIQEVESLSVMLALATEIGNELGGPTPYTAYLTEGNDVGTIDVGYLVKDTVSSASTTQLFKDLTFVCCGNPADLTHDRPPLVLEAEFTGGARGNGFPFAVMVLHNRSLSGIDTERVQNKRLEQAQSVAQWIDDYQANNPTTPLVVLGDLNAFEFSDGYVDVVGQTAGDFTPTDNTLSGPDLVDPNLVVLTQQIPQAERHSFEFRGNAQALDHALLTEAAMDYFVDLQYGRGNADAPEELFDSDAPGTESAIRASDHDALVVTLSTVPVVIFEDDFESSDTTAWSLVTP